MDLQRLLLKPFSGAAWSRKSLVHHEDTVFSVASQFNSRPADCITATQELSMNDLDFFKPSVDAGISTALVSPSTDAEYDKLLDVESVPMPGGQRCLLALPPECMQEEGQMDLPYLKLFCRFITDRKGVVSGILLVAPNKIFFDPYKSLPLVQEHGCEEYLFSCPVENLSSITFFSDISRIHFNRSTQRRKGHKKPFKVKAFKKNLKTASQPNTTPVSTLVSAVMCDPGTYLGPIEDEVDHGESKDMAEVEKQLEQLALELKTEQHPCAKMHTSDPSVPGQGGASSLMFVRMRQKPQVMKRTGFGSLELGKSKQVESRDAWFALQQDSADELYAYLNQHRPDLCILEGSEEEKAERDEDDFVILDDGEEGGEEPLKDGRAGDEWEMVCVEDSRGIEFHPADKESEELSDILKQSLILSAEQVRELSCELPPRTVGHSWRLAYSTSKHGASLKTLYRKLKASDSPVLLLIKDDNEQVFGSFLSHPLRLSETFYGTGETFLFLLHPRFKCFRWTGENSFFIKGDLDSFAIGGGSGHFGLWVDEALYMGRSSPCYTFNNCSLSEKSDFWVLELEAWAFW